MDIKKTEKDLGNGVSVPLRGKEGAGPLIEPAGKIKFITFPSPCGVRRVRDTGGSH